MRNVIISLSNVFEIRKEKNDFVSLVSVL